ncbi:hypothetical protein D3C85_1218630 [compost metagenome]
MLAHHLARYRVDRRLADRQHQAGPRDGADTAAGNKTHAGFGAQAHLAVEQGAVGYVRVVAGVLEGAGFGAGCRQAAELQAHLNLLALGQDDVDCIARLAAEQQPRCRQAGGGGAAAGGQAAAQRDRVFACFVTHRGVWSLRAR